MITTLNAFGHCASYDTIRRHETALTTLQGGENLFVPTDMVKREPTILVFDNQDYNEETKSGKGQTHIAAEIHTWRKMMQLALFLIYIHNRFWDVQNPHYFLVKPSILFIFWVHT